MFTPVVPLDAAEPKRDATVAAPPAVTTSPENVYLLRVTEELPRAKIPTVLLPAAEPVLDAAVDAVADATVQLEYVYLLRVVAAPQPSANIPIVLLPVAAPPEEHEVAEPPAVIVSPA